MLQQLVTLSLFTIHTHLAIPFRFNFLVKYKKQQQTTAFCKALTFNTKNTCAWNKLVNILKTYWPHLVLSDFLQYEYVY